MEKDLFLIGICDDDKRELEKANNAIASYSATHDVRASIFSFDKPSLFLDSLKEHAYGLILLDVCMPGLTGIDVAREVRKNNKECGIVFLTTSREYAVEAFEVDAAQYLIKPYGQAEFDIAMDKVFKRIDKPERCIIVKSDGVIRRLNVDKIIFAESDKHYVDIIMDGGDICRVRTTIDDFYKELSVHKGFAQPHKSYVVNMKYIKSISAEGLTINGPVIPVSKGRYAQFKAEYVRFVFGKE